MANFNQGRIGEQNEAYRKGLVLGLTMAEVGILLIFVLLLLLVFGEKRREMFTGKEPVARSDLARLRAQEKTLQEIAKELGIEAEDASEHFVRLVRVVQQAVQHSSGKTALVEARSALDDIKRAKQEIHKIVTAGQKDGSNTVAERLESLVFDNANKEGQIRHLEGKLVAAGQGKDARPCWVQTDGSIDYLYDVVLTSTGIKMRERVFSHRERERQLIPAPTTDPREILSEGTFLERTRALFKYSQTKDCRFFVVVYDATGTHEKETYKNLLKAVEGHFYKKLDYGPAPF